MPIHNSNGNPFSGGVKYTGGGKIGDLRAIFDGYRRMTLSDSQPGFQGHCVLTSRITQKRCVLGTKLLKNTNTNGTTLNDLE